MPTGLCVPGAESRPGLQKRHWTLLGSTEGQCKGMSWGNIVQRLPTCMCALGILRKIILSHIGLA